MDYRLYAGADTAHPLAQAAFEEDGKLNSLSFRTHAGQWFIVRRQQRPVVLLSPSCHMRIVPDG